MSRLSPHELDDIRARVSLADIAGGYVRLRKSGRRLVGPCPVCGGKADSVRFEILPDGESWVCAVCPDGGDVIRLVEKVEGLDFRAAIERLGGRAAQDQVGTQKLFYEREKRRLKREAVAETFREAERRRLYRAWLEAQPLAGSVAGRYLAGRGLLLPGPKRGLRALEHAVYFHGEEIDLRGRKVPKAIHRGPALLAAFVRADGTFGGLHTTFLEDGDPPRKLQIHDPESGEILPAKKMRGSKRNAVIILDQQASPRRLMLGEGIETVLAVRTAEIAIGRPMSCSAFWAAGDLGNLAGRATENVAHPTAKRPDGRAQRVPGPMPDPDDPGIAIPDSVEDLILLGDGDSDSVLTGFAMDRAARRYFRPGRMVRIAMAPAGADFNDVLGRAG